MRVHQCVGVVAGVGAVSGVGEGESMFGCT